MKKPVAKIEKTNYQGWPNCYRMTNGEVELVITGDIGPRIMRYAFVGGRNLFHEFAGQMGRSGESTWQNRVLYEPLWHWGARTFPHRPDSELLAQAFLP